MPHYRIASFPMQWLYALLNIEVAIPAGAFGASDFFREFFISGIYCPLIKYRYRVDIKWGHRECGGLPNLIRRNKPPPIRSGRWPYVGSGQTLNIISQWTDWNQTPAATLDHIDLPCPHEAVNLGTWNANHGHRARNANCHGNGRLEIWNSVAHIDIS